MNTSIFFMVIMSGNKLWGQVHGRKPDFPRSLNQNKQYHAHHTDSCLHHCVENVKIIAIQLNKTSNNEESYIRHKCRYS